MKKSIGIRRMTAALEDPRLGIHLQGWKNAEIALPEPRETFYRRSGDLFAWLCLAAAAPFWILGLCGRPQSAP